MIEKIKRDDDGALYEEIEGEREAGDGEGDKNFVMSSELSAEELKSLGIEVEEQ